MGKNVIARQDGDRYQANFFWLQACGLNHPYTNVKQVAWEMDSTCGYGFDDVVVFYESAINDAGNSINEDYYQVKCHVDHDRGFTWQALMEPEFIGAKRESLLQRLYKNYLAEADKFPGRRYTIVNTWGVDHSNDLKNLLDNRGMIRLGKLFEGGGNSKFGKIREAWKEHLNIDSDDVLKVVLGQLRIHHSFDNETRLQENLNCSLKLAGLVPVPADQMANKYGDLIQRLHKADKNIFTRDELMEICRAENLVVDKEETQEDYFALGIRSFQRGAESLGLEVNTLACFLHCFSSRFLLEEHAGMEYINKELIRVADEAMASKKKVLVHLDTHLSIALLLGYHMDSKYSGVDVTIVQKTSSGKLLWRADAESIREYSNALWTVEEREVNDAGADIALSISIAHDIREHVNGYVRETLPQVKTVVNFTIDPKPGLSSIRDANHIIAAIEELISVARKTRLSVSSTARVHLFISAPNAFAFYLGQRIKPLGKVTLYEFDFEGYRDGSYHPIISIPQIPQ